MIGLPLFNSVFPLGYLTRSFVHEGIVELVKVILMLVTLGNGDLYFVQ